MTDSYDIAIVGGGMVGLALAAALVRVNFSVAIVESREPDLEWKNTHYDARVSAVHLGTQAFLSRIGVWSAIRSSSYSPLECMQVWDDVGGGRIRFDASDIAKDVLGYIVENREIVRVLWEYCNAHERVTLLSNTTPTAIDGNTITFRHGNSVTASLIVGADGAHSWLRQQMNIECVEKPYHHDAIVAVIETEKPHHCTAFQPFLSTGPLGVLPLSDLHRMAIVWSADPARIENLLAMSSDDFNRELMNALGDAVGKVQCLSERKRIRLIERHAKQYVQGNKILVGDAAHTIHPLAGQGANLGFMDAACLARVLSDAKKAREAIHNQKVLRRYERWRKSENALMLLSMSGFKSVFSSRSPITVSLRSWGFNVTNRFKVLKKFFMQCAVHEKFP